MNSYFAIVTLVLSILLLILTNQQTPINSLNAAIITSTSTVVTMVTNNVPNSSFIQDDNFFDCSLTALYSYTQTNVQYMNNTPYFMSFTGITQQTAFSLSTVHGNFEVTYQPTSCTSNCQITIQNNCPAIISFDNYFDRVVLNISGYPQLLSYYVKCDQQYLSNTFEWGIVIQIVFITILCTIVALYSRAWSLGGRGINVKPWLLILFNCIIIIGAIIGYFAENALVICLDVLTFILGILGVAICVNELLFLLRLKILAIVIFKIKTFQFRILQIISLLVGTGLLIGWWFGEGNIIINDIICLCMVVGFIKILKFTSLFNATLGFAITMTILIILAGLIYLSTGTSYNNLIINYFNYPFLLQIPTINPVYFQKCAWLPFNSIIYPGMLFSFLRRFDSSRNTTLYVVLATVTFFIGGIGWMFISLASPLSFPFGLVSQPCMVGLVCIFSYRRRELGVLWRGQFYDEEFGNRQDLKVTMEMVERQSARDSTLGPQLLESAKRNPGSPRGSNASQATDVIRSKFLKQTLK